MGTISYDFSGETAIVTGGSSGIGRAIAIGLGESGANVVVADVRESPKDVDADVPTHEAIQRDGGEAAYVETDVSDLDQIRTAVEAAREFGGVDVFVNNAALHLGGPFAEITPAEFDRIHAVNVRGVFFGMQAAAIDMRDRDTSGAIVNIASISSSRVQEENAIYESTKASVKMLTRSGAYAFADDGIRVNAVAPGYTATEFIDGLTEQHVDQAENDEFLKPLPLSRPAYPDDVARAVLFLASDGADYTTGEVMHVDGGWQIL